MKNRIAASLALAVGLALGASGCSLIAHNGTLESYAPSDGVQITSGEVALRNIMLVADESGENLNLVFTAVNNGAEPADVTLNLQGEQGEAEITFVAEPGSTSFGDPARDQDTLIVTVPGADAGQTVETFFTINGTGDLVEFVPVLDGTLKEYASYVLDELPALDLDTKLFDIEKMTEDEIAAAAKQAGETVEAFTKRISEQAGSTAKG